MALGSIFALGLRRCRSSLAALPRCARLRSTWNPAMLCAARRKRRGQIDAAAHSGGTAAPQLWHGRGLRRLRPQQARARIGYMSHAPMLYDELTAQENLRYFASLYPGRDCLDAGRCAAPGGARPRAESASGPLLARHAPAHLAGPRAGSRPELLLLDEPFSNMDVECARQMVELLAASGRAIAPSCLRRISANCRADRRLGAHAPRRPRASFDQGARRDEDQWRALSGIARHRV